MGSSQRDEAYRLLNLPCRFSFSYKSSGYSKQCSTASKETSAFFLYIPLINIVFLSFWGNSLWHRKFSFLSNGFCHLGDDYFAFFIIDLLKKLGIDCSKDKNSFDHVVLNAGVDQRFFHGIHNVCEHMMRQQCSAHDLMQVPFFVSCTSSF